MPMWQRGRDPVITVHIACEGYLRRENGIVLEAHSTVALVRSGRLLVLVDTSSRERRPRLLEGLGSLGVGPEDIEVVVNTHLHLDHVGNNDLFPRASKLARQEEGPGPEYEAVGGDRELGPGIRLIHTPGHTRGSMSVVVEADDARYVIAGDAMPTKGNYDRWAPPGINYDAVTALRSMGRIVDEAEVVVPGHGAPFSVERFSRPA
jgi:N-acyl homoserine lactone hydrolase